MRSTIYLMPGMGARSSIFKGLRFPENFRIVPMEWLMPEGDEDLRHYTQRLIHTYRIEPQSILLGMSFGGVIIHEIAKQMPVDRLIFISTVKTHREFPPWFALGRWLHIWNFLPYPLITHPIVTARFVPPGKLRKRLYLYEEYMAVKDTRYFRWAMKSIMTWRSDMPSLPYIHIHGDKDHVFPLRYLKGEIYPVSGADHLAVMTHPHKINQILKAYLTGLQASSRKDLPL